MESRRLVVWIATGILGFPGPILCFDLLNCTALSWLYMRLNGFAVTVQCSVAPAREPPLQHPRGRAGYLIQTVPHLLWRVQLGLLFWCLQPGRSPG
jgi:hypothetical protein